MLFPRCLTVVAGVVLKLASRDVLDARRAGRACAKAGGRCATKGLGAALPRPPLGQGRGPVLKNPPRQKRASGAGAGRRCARADGRTRPDYGCCNEGVSRGKRIAMPFMTA